MLNDTHKSRLRRVSLWKTKRLLILPYPSGSEIINKAVSAFQDISAPRLPSRLLTPFLVSSRGQNRRSRRVPRHRERRSQVEYLCRRYSLLRIMRSFKGKGSSSKTRLWPHQRFSTPFLLSAGRLLGLDERLHCRLT